MNDTFFQPLLALISGILAGYLYEFAMIRVGKFIKKSKVVIHKYKLHHSLYGLFFIITGFIVNSIPLVAFGIGIIIQHSISGDGFVFVTKEG